MRGRNPCVAFFVFQPDGFEFKPMSDALSDAITTTATSPNSVTADGVTVVNNRIPEQIAGKKFLDANSALSGIAAGTSFFARSRMIPPSARGGSSTDDC